MKLLTLLAAPLLALVLAEPAPARAQSAIQCGCYCGLVISPPCSEQACKQACGWNNGDDGNGHEGPVRLWYCRAVAPDGAWGWASSSDQASARQNALGECQQRASGCALEACRVNDPRLAQAPRITQPPAGGQGQTTAQPEWCELCTRKLQNDVNAGWTSALVRSYVGQAIGGYENCKGMGARAGGACPIGDQLGNDLRRCCERYFFSAYRDCISDALSRAR